MEENVAVIDLGLGPGGQIREFRRIRRNGQAYRHLNHSTVVQSSSTPAEFYGNLCFVAIAGRPTVYRKDLACAVKAIQFDAIEHAHISYHSRRQIRTADVC